MARPDRCHFMPKKEDKKQSENEHSELLQKHRDHSHMISDTRTRIERAEARRKEIEAAECSRRNLALQARRHSKNSERTESFHQIASPSKSTVPASSIGGGNLQTYDCGMVNKNLHGELCNTLRVTAQTAITRDISRRQRNDSKIRVRREDNDPPLLERARSCATRAHSAKSARMKLVPPIPTRPKTTKSRGYKPEIASSGGSLFPALVDQVSYRCLGGRSAVMIPSIACSEEVDSTKHGQQSSEMIAKELSGPGGPWLDCGEMVRRERFVVESCRDSLTWIAGIQGKVQDEGQGAEMDYSAKLDESVQEGNGLTYPFRLAG
jgi:hypothetical protein